MKKLILISVFSFFCGFAFSQTTQGTTVSADPTFTPPSVTGTTTSTTVKTTGSDAQVVSLPSDSVNTGTAVSVGAAPQFVPPPKNNTTKDANKPK